MFGVEVPEEFICPISQVIMKDPYVDIDGNSYEREYIIDWLQRNSVSPLTRNSLLAKDLVPNRSLRGLIEAFMRKHPNLCEEFVECKVMVQTKRQSESKLDRQPLALFVVLDNSGSMGGACGGEHSEEDLYCRLDLVKHTLNTTISALTDEDRICIIKFNTVGEIFTPLLYMNDVNKQEIIDKLATLEPTGQTNIWDGLRIAIDEIAKLQTSDPAAFTTNIQVYLLTDGEPTINPPSTLTYNFGQLYSAKMSRSPTNFTYVWLRIFFRL